MDYATLPRNVEDDILIRCTRPWPPFLTVSSSSRRDNLLSPLILTVPQNNPFTARLPYSLPFLLRFKYISQMENTTKLTMLLGITAI